MNPINIAIADDHLLVINGLKAMLENTNDIRILFFRNQWARTPQRIERESAGSFVTRYTDA